MIKTLNSKREIQTFGHLIFEFWYCFGFRASDLEFIFGEEGVKG